MEIYPKLIIDALSTVRYPGTGKNVVEMKMVEDDLRIAGLHVSFSLIFDKPTDPFMKSMVKACEGKGCDLEDLTQEDLQAIDSRVTRESLGDISIKSCVDARMSFGGTAPAEVRRQIAVGRAWLESQARR